MHIEKYTVNGIDYLRLITGKRMKSRKGNPIIGKKTVLSLGPMSKLDDGKPDFLTRLRKSFSEGAPLVDSLKPYVDQAPPPRCTITYNVGGPLCVGEPKRMAPCVLDPVFRDLGLDELFASIKCASHIKYDLTGIVRLLTYGRLLAPASKWATMGQNSDYYTPLVKSPNTDNVYDALDVIHNNHRQIIRRMNTCITRGTGRTTTTMFYDVTNFFFEIPQPDNDTVECDGTVTKGLRKMGVSKEKRKQPIVQVGLFLDDNGIPVAFDTFPGNTLDHHTLRPALEKTLGGLKLGRFILVADRGMYSGTNMQAVRDAGNGYIVSKSLRKTEKKEREWATDVEGYTVVSADFRHKSRVLKRKVVDGNGDEIEVEEKVVVYWSRAFYERERNENRSFLEFIDRLKANPGSFRITSAQSRDLRRFLKKEYLNKATGETVDSAKLMPMIDEEKLNAFNDLMGYYQIVTSETSLGDREIIEKYHGLTQIEDQFREMKGTLETRPVFLSTSEHIRAHFMICFMALTMLRLIQRKTKPAVAEKKSSGGWSYGMSGERIAKALDDWKVLEHPGDYYQMLKGTGDDLTTILKVFGMELKAKLYTRGEIREMKSHATAF